MASDRKGGITSITEEDVLAVVNDIVRVGPPATDPIVRPEQLALVSTPSQPPQESLEAQLRKLLVHALDNKLDEAVKLLQGLLTGRYIVAPNAVR